MRFAMIKDLEDHRAGLIAGEPDIPYIRVCAGPGCLANGSMNIYNALLAYVDEKGLKVDVDLKAEATGCQGFCERGPLVMLSLKRGEDEIFYQHVREKDVPDIIEKTVLTGELVQRLLYRDPAKKQTVTSPDGIPFYSHQRHVVLKNLGRINPLSLDDAIRAGVYAGLGRALAMEPAEVVKVVKDSGLRGRGGGGFPTGVKWESAAIVDAPQKFVVVNGDEGDPGAFMDRAVMEGDPHTMLEGLAIGGYAIGATRGIIYVRNEYPLAVEHLRVAIDQAREVGLLGKNILGSGFDFEIEIVRGGGAFVCGESTALMTSIEGRAGVPRVKYIRSTEKGLWDLPAVLNNVETWANVPQILLNGADWFRAMGTPKSTGTKVFSLVGKVKNSGLVEVPMGTTLRTIIFEIGGGVLNDRTFKAVQTGGPSGGCLPASELDRPVDFDQLKAAGSMMGSGGMIVMDDHTCMVNVAQYFVDFLVEESCGKCTPCREGLKAMQGLLHGLTSGTARPGDTVLLKEIAENVRDTALCGLGKTAANPVLSTMHWFPEEYEEHEKEGFCRAGVCKGLYALEIDPEVCTGCTLCAKVCPVNAATGEKKEPHVIDRKACVTCGSCLDVCRFKAIKVVRRGE
ncbi:MAG: NADH-ubiquinone oxidoreductase-F iron-sulfur binding region domain-containing protein [Methanofollis sp.]|uniref:NADH-ubiquinone oxidoreductase-F iron-sulfur binding region domain-containing protein n=1 Tax=Methanofollis sp. TaxID=2052835 RepID=UPI0026271460|nr:NADH-ubiquinone oxidoreductase-F iron-sulfur binding region domain-containing protein [Methanofollis sp.]MDD4254177.1 NADH-ubiquinone oxidoreductase-F iron-sulfur binding region domain-containing protein [Methanofollis sp.]